MNSKFIQLILILSLAICYCQAQIESVEVSDEGTSCYSLEVNTKSIPIKPGQYVQICINVDGPLNVTAQASAYVQSGGQQINMAVGYYPAVPGSSCVANVDTFRYVSQFTNKNSGTLRSNYIIPQNYRAGVLIGCRASTICNIVPTGQVCVKQLGSSSSLKSSFSIIAIVSLVSMLFFF